MTTKAKPESSTQPATGKGQKVFDLLTRDGGATLEEMSAATDWQLHSTRAFLTGLKKKGHEVVSEKVEGVHLYRIVTPT